MIRIYKLCLYIYKCISVYMYSPADSLSEGNRHKLNFVSIVNSSTSIVRLPILTIIARDTMSFSHCSQSSSVAKESLGLPARGRDNIISLQIKILIFSAPAPLFCLRRYLAALRAALYHIIMQ